MKPLSFIQPRIGRREMIRHMAFVGTGLALAGCAARNGNADQKPMDAAGPKRPAPAENPPATPARTDEQRMKDLLELIIVRGSSAGQDGALRPLVAQHIQAVLSAGTKDRSVVAAAEKAVSASPATAFTFDAAGSATLSVEGHTWQAGRFETPSIAELRTRVASLKQPGKSGQLRLWALEGASPATDIGTLQATSGDGTLFQVASQFNCLESPGPHMARVASYFTDPTQGPRASISAFPGTLLRHYAAPGPQGRFAQQTDGPQIDLLADACGPGVSRNGYFTGAGHSAEPLVAALEERFESIRIGLHDQVEVVFGHNWDGQVPAPAPRIAQVFTSTAAGGRYGAEQHLGRDGFQAACRQLLRAAYLGTLLAAASSKRRRVVLTLIGGGVFGNPVRLIRESIEWAMDQVEPLLAEDMDVFINGWNLGAAVEQFAPAVKKHRGAVVSFGREGVMSIR